MSAGKIVVTFRLPCYFAELEPFFVYPKDESPKALVDAIEEALGRTFPVDKVIEALGAFHPLQVAKGLHALSEDKE